MNEASRPGVGALILAAGFSRRFGDSKLTATLNNGNCVFQQTLLNISQFIPDVLVVTRPELVSVLKKWHKNTIIFDGANEGMGSTLAFGIRQIRDWDACLICLGDMPFIKPSTYRILSQQLDSENIVMPTFKGKTGNPAGFGKRYFNTLGQLSGESGARKIVEKEIAAVRQIEIDDPGIIQDIDTPADLARLQNC